MAITISSKHVPEKGEIPSGVTPMNEDHQVELHGSILCDLNKSLCERFDSLFELKRLGGQKAIDYISSAFEDKSPFLKHELAYVLGQMRDRRTLPILYKVLEDHNEHPMVRHEVSFAGEAIGATGDPNSLPILKKYLVDKEVAVRETCELAIERIKYEMDLNKNNINSKVERNSPYTSVDPAPPEDSEEEDSLENSLIDTSLPLFKRYKAMFSLRNINDEKSVAALGRGLLSEKKSALFKHEIAYVFGQMQNEASVYYLKKVLNNKEEDFMVRHECAEALGSIGTEEALDALRVHLEDKCDIVRESCEVGLGIAKVML